MIEDVTTVERRISQPLVPGVPSVDVTIEVEDPDVEPATALADDIADAVHDVLEEAGDDAA